MSGTDPNIWGNNNDEVTVKKYETDAAIQCGEFVPSDEHSYTRNTYPGGHNAYSDNELLTPKMKE